LAALLEADQLRALVVRVFEKQLGGEALLFDPEREPSQSAAHQRTRRLLSPEPG
jgi:hypothetical protein